jgi:NADH-quinone oxidoreductase subunit G
MTKILVDGKIDRPYTLLQAWRLAPKFCFCYHERLSIAGNCRMCLIEVKGGPPKPVASCAQNVRDLRPGPNGELPAMFTKSPMVKKAREGVMEFLLINHPLDCPICDQGGECDLQDQAMGYGGHHPFAENKRAVEDKYIGALVKTSMTRCIQCTRCVRFTTEVRRAGNGPDRPRRGRGDHDLPSDRADVGAAGQPCRYLSGRRADLEALCVCGASVGGQDPIHRRDGCRRLQHPVDTRGREVMRILPRVNENVNEEWISDKTRHIVDGLRTQRVSTGRTFARTASSVRPRGPKRSRQSLRRPLRCMVRASARLQVISPPSRTCMR